MTINWARAHLRSRVAAPIDRAPVRILVALLLTMLPNSGCRRRTADEYLVMGDQATRESKLAEAESDYQAAVQAAPNDPRTHVALGNLYLSEGKPGPAQLEFMKVLEFDPKNAAAHAALANLYMAQAQYGMAEAQYRAAIVLDPARPGYHLEAASVLMKESKLAEAEAEIRTAVGLDPKNGQAHFALANLLNTEPGRQAEAQTEYAEAKTLDPRLVPASAAPPVPSAPPVAGTVAAAPPSSNFKVRPVDKKFLLTHDSPVYQSPDAASRVVAHVHARGFVRVIGITGDWLQIRMHSGVVGFIPVRTAE